MPKKTGRDNRAGRELRTVHSAGSRLDGLLQRITKRANVMLPVPGGPAGAAPEPWLQRLRAALPEELRPHLTGVLEKSGELVLFAGSATWASRLKLVLPELAPAAGGRRLVVKLDPGRGQ